MRTFSPFVVSRRKENKSNHTREKATKLGEAAAMTGEMGETERLNDEFIEHQLNASYKIYTVSLSHAKGKSFWII